MSDKTPEQRIKHEIENDIKHTLKNINKNTKQAKKLASELHILFKQQDCRHNWIDTGSFILCTSKCTKYGREDTV